MGMGPPRGRLTPDRPRDLAAGAATTVMLAIRFRPRGIHGSAICPRPIEAPMLMDWLLKDQTVRAPRPSRQPGGRLGRPG